MMTGKTIFLFIMTILVCSFSGLEQENDKRSEQKQILRKQRIKIVITDSGTGGLSVMNDIAEKLNKSGSFKSVELIFVNALFDAESGYNSLQTREEKIEAFDRVLTAIDFKYKPDLIMVACNTLSVLIDETRFVRAKTPPVIGIIEPGVRLIIEGLEDDKESRVIIFGTETTIEENSHKLALILANIDNSRISTKACPQLQSYIEQAPEGEETEMLISLYLNEALSALSDHENAVHISLNCSHFAYSEKFWAKGIKESGYKPGSILNPNKTMGDMLVTDENKGRYSGSDISLQVVSKVELVNTESLINIFSQSKSMVAAIKNYKIIPDLF